MKIHEREPMVKRSAIALRDAVDKWRDVHKLTTPEELRVLNQVFGSEIAAIAKYAIREERHGDSSKPGGLA